MAEFQEISIQVPGKLLKEIDQFAEAEGVCRTEFILRALRAYIQARNGERIRESLQAGYAEMASLNLQIAQQWFKLENEGGEVLLEDLTGGGDVADN